MLSGEYMKSEIFHFDVYSREYEFRYKNIFAISRVRKASNCNICEDILSLTTLPRVVGRNTFLYASDDIEIFP